jgi:translation initiation factor IF-2
LRDDEELFDGKVSSLKRFKDDVPEVTAGFECGIGIEGFDDLAEGDVLEFYNKERVS